MKRKNISFNQPLEKTIGFSRGVRLGNYVAISGTAPIAEDGSVFSPGNVYEQAKYCLGIITKVIEEAGGKPEDVIRTRVFLKDISTWKEAAKAHGDFFSKIMPACTFVEISSFVNPEWLIEIEADAIVRE